MGSFDYGNNAAITKYTQTAVLQTSQTISVPPGTKRIEALLCGGGGGGSIGGYGGGGFGGCQIYNIPVTGQPIVVVIGSGGAQNAAGGSTTVTAAGTLYAAVGGGGTNGGGAVLNATSAAKFGAEVQGEVFLTNSVSPERHLFQLPTCFGQRWTRLKTQVALRGTLPPPTATQPHLCSAAGAAQPVVVADWLVTVPQAGAVVVVVARVTLVALAAAAAQLIRGDRQVAQVAEAAVTLAALAMRGLVAQWLRFRFGA